MNLKYIHDGRNLILEKIKDFDVAQTVECGQFFHYEKISDGEYALVYRKNLLHIKEDKEKIIFYDTTEDEFKNIWTGFFDLNRDYSLIQNKIIKADIRLKDTIRKGKGIRIIDGDYFETLMSFIISQNKQIPHIRKIVFDISKQYGEFLGNIKGMDFYSFPDVNALKDVEKEEYVELKTGFRAKYLRDAVLKVLKDEKLSEDSLKKAGYENALNKLMEIKGVGNKVANCVLLFSLGYTNAFPVDVWIKRIMTDMYFDGNEKVSNEEIYEYGRKLFGEYGGFAQQYLFLYIRENSKDSGSRYFKKEKTKK